MKPNKVIALLTDFGDKDWFVGAMKGVIKNIAPNSEIIDITHQTASYSVAQAAFILKNCYSYFPQGTVFCIVVDPGVGGKRKNIIAINEKYIFVGPDNGVFSFAAKESEKWDCYEIDTDKINKIKGSNKKISSTFHGRDIFAPTAAKISTLKNASEIIKYVKKISSFTMLEQVSTKLIKAKFKNKNTIYIEGEIIYIDIFGNMITNISKEILEEQLIKKRIKPSIEVHIDNRKIIGISKTYSEIGKGKAVAYFGSSDYLEIGINMGRADKIFKSSIGKKVKVLIF